MSSVLEHEGVSMAEVTRADGKVAPCLWIESDGKIEIFVEALQYGFYKVDLQHPYQQTKQVVASVANLLRYFLAEGKPSLDERGFRSFINDYFVKRSNGDPKQCWNPLGRRALESELRNLAAFSEFCELHYGYLPLTKRISVPLPTPERHRGSFWRLLQSNEREFLSHLAVRRDRPSHFVRLPGRRSKGGGAESLAGMTAEFMWQVIEAERNLTFKALWLLGCFGGPRLSESLNLWVCDVLPGMTRTHLFPGDIFVDFPLVVIADPWASRWVGKLGDNRLTRSEFLNARFGMVPRPLMAESDAGEFRGRAAGYKGTRPTNREGEMRQVFWVDEHAARMFEAVVIEVLAIRNRMPKSHTHPFLFVNTDPRKPALQGQMLSLSNVRKAFERAIRRVGETPYRFKQTPHGMRHLYKDIAKRVCGGDEGAVQICMGHYSRDSQDMYGSLDMQAMRHAMAFSR